MASCTWYCEGVFADYGSGAVVQEGFTWVGQQLFRTRYTALEAPAARKGGAERLDVPSWLMCVEVKYVARLRL